jgi:hypothetical protein
MNTNYKQRLDLIFKFVETFQNQIKKIDFDINNNEFEQICGIIELNENSNLKAMEQFLIENKCNSIFDYWEFEKEKLFIEME